MAGSLSAILVLLALASTPCKVTAVLDGDTLRVTVSAADFAELKAAHPGLKGTAEKLSVRLAHCDAPEKAQPYGPEAKIALEALVIGKSLKLSDVEVDRYGRAVAVVKVGRSIVNRSMLLQGHAWWYYHYSSDVSMAKAEASARAAKRGVWSELPEAPWMYRQRISGEPQ